MSLAELEDEHDQLFQSARVLPNFGDNCIFVDQMVKEQWFGLVAELRVDLRWGIHDAKENKFVHREHGVRVSNSSLYVETIIYSLTQRSPLDSRVDRSEELTDWGWTLGKRSERIIMLTLVVVLYHSIILRHGLVLEIANVQICVVVLYDAVDFLLLQLIESVVISFISVFEFVISFFHVFTF